MAVTSRSLGSVPVNGGQDALDISLILRRREALGLSQRALGRILGVSALTIHTLERDGRAHGGLTVAFLISLADALGVGLLELFACHSTGTEPAAPDDVKLEAALLDDHSPKLVHKASLAKAFGWTSKRVDNAAGELAKRLAPTGLNLHTLSGIGVGLRARHAVIEDVERRTLGQAEAARGGMKLAHARLLRRVIAGEIDQEWRRSANQNGRMALDGLRKRGLVRDLNGHAVLSPETADSLFMLEDNL